MRPIGIPLVKWACATALAVTACTAAVVAHAQANWSVEVQTPGYYQPPPQPVYVQPPPVYYAPAPGYYQPPPAYYPPPPPPPSYYRPAPGYGGPPPYYGPQPRYQQAPPKLSDMQRRALDNCVLLAPREQPRCRATVMSTTR
ncbi:hypothetical protein QTH87_01625 [Variovorax sp. J22P168]|uniref:hypothetical protein n=1 Tax=Variovorax jilinensis TaxID=3053513 RepID=UPI0025750F2C|nr:hypothetical protein [Variovorax sp. J22P168]MDM0011126.1 hypothetical protein [Variovorax sp. J22P168]